MNRAHRSIASCLAVAVAFGVGVPAATADTAGVEDEVLVQAAQEFLQHRAGNLVSGQVGTSDIATLAGGAVTTANTVRATEAAVSGELSARKNRLSDAGEQYTASRTALSDVEVNRTGATKAELVVREQTTLDYAKIRGDEPPDTGYAVERTFTFQRIRGVWTLTGQRMKDEGGALPVTEVAIASTGTQIKGEGAASTDRPSSTASDKVTAALNYQAAANYASRYVYNYNPAYRRFSDVGGDCTNFISQALRAGGWSDVPGWYRDYRYWWYNSLNETWSWINVNFWASFALHSRRTYNLTNVWYLGLADIMQMDFSANGSKDHSMIVTYRSASSPYLSYHTTDTHNRSLQSILDQYRNATYYAFRT